MRKVISLFLCVMMVLGVFSGCSGEQIPTDGTTEATQPKLEHVLQVGYG